MEKMPKKKCERGANWTLSLRTKPDEVKGGGVDKNTKQVYPRTPEARKKKID